MYYMSITISMKIDLDGFLGSLEIEILFFLKKYKQKNVSDKTEKPSDKPVISVFYNNYVVVKIARFSFDVVL
jgi:ferric iron reductase protein FhuF